MDDYTLTVKDVCEKLGISRTTLMNWREAKPELTYKKCALTGKIRYSESALAKLIETA